MSKIDKAIEHIENLNTWNPELDTKLMLEAFQQAKKDREEALELIKKMQYHLPIARVNLQIESDKLIKQLSE